MWVSTAYAQAASGGTAAPGGTDLMALLPLVLVFVVFYFLLIRPQQKRMKDHKAMLDSLRRGDRVVTGGGILGTIIKVGGDDGDDVTVEIAENVRIKVLRTSIAETRSKPEPVRSKSGGDGQGAGDNATPPAPPAGGFAKGLGRLFGRH